MLNLLLIDPDARTRQRLGRFLIDEAHAAVVGNAVDSRTALDQCRLRRWDVAILDTAVPSASTQEILVALRAQQPAMPVIVLSFYLEADHIRQCLALGAAGYIATERLTEDIGPAIHAALHGETYLCPVVRRVLQSASPNASD